MARFCPLFSSSSGNSTFIRSSTSGILIDAGVSCKKLMQALETVGAYDCTVSAVAITHEHSDHIKGLKTFLKKTGIPVIASEKTLVTLQKMEVIPCGIKVIAADTSPIVCGDMQLTRFATSHDCEGSSGYIIALPDGTRTAVCTDLGVVTDTVLSHLKGCDTLLFESNHDIRMLQNGPYPALLKMRIASDSGHLSNVACAAVLPELLKAGAKRFILGHLSQHNNLPMLAKSTATAALMDCGAVENNDYTLQIARPEGNEVTVI